MHDAMSGPFWGNVIIVAVTGVITLVCFLVMFRLLFHPGETDRRHPKYEVLRDDR